MSLHLSAPGHIPWADLAGVRVGVVLWGGLAVLDVARIAAAPSYVELGTVGLLVMAASVGMRPVTGVVSAVVGWSLVDGFVEHSYGVLGFDVWRDVRVLALFISLAMVATRAIPSTRAAR